MEDCHQLGSNFISPLCHQFAGNAVNCIFFPAASTPCRSIFHSNAATLLVPINRVRPSSFPARGSHRETNLGCSSHNTLLSQVLINPHHAARPDLLEVTAYSPTHRPLGCPVSEDNGTFYASFQPDEAGEWKIHVTYDDEDIENSPFKCMVFDPRAIHVRRPSNDGSI